MDERDRKAIGSMNGRWAWLFKFGLAITPIIGGAQGWVIHQNGDIRERLARLETAAYPISSREAVLAKVEANALKLGFVEARVARLESKMP